VAVSAISAWEAAMLHADPVDRLIVATARTHDVTLVTKDGRLRRLDAVRTVW
jgi:PIN domain nuclease of toxin-antitoxin system